MPTNVQFIRKELADKLPIYKKIDDCLKQKVKDGGEVYLPYISPADRSPDNDARYLAYRTRAVFYDVTSRTLNGLVGQAYANDPEIVVPDLLKPIVVDANGKNITLEQSSKETTEYVLSKGRCGLFIDYPKTNGAISVAQAKAGNIKPTISIYGPANVINWDFEKIGGKWILSLVVLKETVQVRQTDSFELVDQDQYRVLSLRDGKYIQELYKLVENTNAPGNPANDKGTFNFESSPTDLVEVKDSAGIPLKEIPFTFVGCVNNDPDVDPAPLDNLAELNIAHYRNSADYEESCFVVGQPTYVVSGLTAQWLDNQLKGKIKVGSRGGLPLPVGADAKILQPEPNSMPMEAMLHKEKQMVAIGAKLVEQKEVQQTATAANIENTSETSILATACKNVSAAYLYALQICCKMQGATFTDETLKFEINTDFAINKLTPEEQAAVIAQWQAAAITFEEMRAQLRVNGTATLDDEAAKAQLDADQAKKADQAASAAKKLAEAVPPVPVGKPLPNNA